MPMSTSSSLPKTTFRTSAPAMTRSSRRTAILTPTPLQLASSYTGPTSGPLF
jgi:hypothetical protein